MLVTVDGHSVLRFWDVATGALLRTSGALQAEYAASGGVGQLAFDRDGDSLYASSASAIAVLDATSGTLRRKLAAGAPNICHFCLSPDGKSLAIARRPSTVNDSGEGVAELWDLASGELKTTLAREYGGAMSVAFSPDGRTLATGHRDGTIALWQAATDEEVRRQAPP
jgi:WD40 repeat protein